MIIVKDENCNVENITNLLKKRIPDVEIDQDIGAELSYSLADEKSALFPEMFEELESRKTELGIASYGASITTMEEVFIRVGREAEKRIAEEYLKNHEHERIEEIPQPTVSTESNGNGVHVNIADNASEAQTPELSTTDLVHITEDTSKRRNTGIRLIIQQLQAMLTKKCIYVLRNRALLAGQVKKGIILVLILEY